MKRFFNAAQLLCIPLSPNQCIPNALLLLPVYIPSAFIFSSFSVVCPLSFSK